MATSWNLKSNSKTLYLGTNSITSLLSCHVKLKQFIIQQDTHTIQSRYQAEVLPGHQACQSVNRKCCSVMAWYLK